MVKAPRGEREAYRSRAARDERDGSARYSGHKAAGYIPQAGWNRGACFTPHP